MPKSIAKAVGFGGANLIPDVRVVQYLLNCIPFRLGGPRRELSIDGFANPDTIEAIRRLQKFRGAEPTGSLSPAVRHDVALLSALFSFDPFPERELPYSAPKSIEETAGGAKTSTSGAKGEAGGGAWSSESGAKAEGGVKGAVTAAGAAGGKAEAGGAGAKADSVASGEKSAGGGGSAGAAKGAAGEAGAKAGGGVGEAAKAAAAGNYDTSKDAAAGPAGKAASEASGGKGEAAAGGSAAAGGGGSKESLQSGDPWGFFNKSSPYYQKAGFGPNAVGKGDSAKSAEEEGAKGAGSKSDSSSSSEAGKSAPTNPDDPWGFYDPASPYYHVAGKAPGKPRQVKLDFVKRASKP
jgi:hypothetical protein